MAPLFLSCRTIGKLIQRVAATNSESELWNRFKVCDKVYAVSGKLGSMGGVVEEPSSPEAQVRC